MFNGAVIKLRDARTVMDRLNTLVIPPVTSNVQIISGPPGVKGDPIGTYKPVEFAEAFSSCVAQIRSVGDAVLKDKEAIKLTAFKAWRELKKDECKNDSLLKFINDRRNGDLHAGDSPLVFTMHPFSFNSMDLGAPPSPTATLLVDGTGPYWVVDQGSPRERRVPCKEIGHVVFTVAVVNAPDTHLGIALPSTDPVVILGFGEKYYANLLFEAKKTFE